TSRSSGVCGGAAGYRATRPRRFSSTAPTSTRSGARATRSRSTPSTTAGTPRRHASAWPTRSGPEYGAPVIQLDDPHGALRRDVHAQLAEHAFIEVLGHDLDAVLTRPEDVHRADLGELGGQLTVVGDRVVDLDGDEQCLAHAATPSLCLTIPGISEISSATTIPASASRAIFSPAVSSLPSTIVPAWPKLIPGISSLNRPAMNATIGRRESLSVTHCASCASIRPPGSV